MPGTFAALDQDLPRFTGEESLERRVQLLQDYQYQLLEQLRQEEERKRAQVVAAKQDTSSLEKLKEKKLDSYNKAVQKSEEAMIDEFVSMTRAMAAQSA